MSSRMLASVPVAIAFALVFAPLPLSAQSPLAGTWLLQLPDAVKNQDGVQTVESTTTATLVLQTKGDSVTGTLTRARSSVARPVRGTATGNALTLEAETKARVNLNGAEMTLNLITTFRLARDGTVLRGTSETRYDPKAKPAVMLPGVEQDPMPVTGTRAPG